MMQKKQTVAFPSSAIYSKSVYDRLQEFSGGYLVVCEAIGEGGDFKSLKRVIASAEGASLYSKLSNLRKGQRALETILKGGETDCDAIEMGRREYEDQSGDGKKSEEF